MNVWYHLSTIFKRCHALPTAGLITLCVAITTTLFFSVPAGAATGVNQTLSFQGRLTNSSGGVVADGYYNIQFKIYQDGAGTSAGNSGGTLKWTENYINNNANQGVQVKNGYFSVTLGSKTAFGSSIDWNEDTLWLSMNVAGTSASCTTFGSSPCTADGEMLPMKRMTSTPFALNAGQLGGKTADGFIQNTTTAQTADFNISGTGKATTLQGNTSVIAPLFDRADTGTLNIGTVNAYVINMGTNNSAHTISIGSGSGNNLLTLGSTHGISSTTIQGGSAGVRINTGAGGFVVHGNNAGLDVLEVTGNGTTLVRAGTGEGFQVRNGSDTGLFSVTSNGIVSTEFGTHFNVRGTATFDNGITVQGTGALTYTAPGGTNLATAINIPNYTVGAYNSVMAFGLPGTSAATARGLLVADGRTGTHQATIGVLSPNEDNILGLSWTSDSGTGNNAVGTLANTGNSLALQGNGLNLLTATNNAGAANVGIGNNASAGYALDVTGTIRATSALYTPAVDTAAAGTLNVGTTNATTVNIATNNAGHTVNIATGTGTQNVNVGSKDSASATNVNGGTGGISIQTGNSATGAGSVSIDTGTGTPATSTVINKTFESSVDNMESWYNASLASSTAQKRTGSKSLAVTVSDAFWGIQQVYPGTTAVAGHQYSFSIWTRAATAGRSISAQVGWIGAGGATSPIGTVSNTTTGWTQLSSTITAPAGTTGMIIQLSNNGGSSVGEVHYFDDIVVVDLSAGGSSQSVEVGANNAARVTIGNVNQTGPTNIYGGGGINLQSASGINLNSNTTITSDKTLTANGSVLFQNATDSTTAFQIQNASGAALFTVNTTAQTITFGDPTSANKTVISTSTGQITKYGTARNTKKITLNAEYTGSVLDAGTGSNNSGTMTSSVDLTNRMNYYKWTTTQGTNQSYDVVVQVPIPTDFDGWASSNPLAISTYTSNTTNGTITLEARDSSNAVQCNFVSVTPGSTGAWATNTSACTLTSGTYTAGDTMTLRIRMQSPNAGDVRIGNINLSYLSKY